MTRKRDVEIDVILGQISAGVTVLHDQAQRMSDEMKVQDVLLNDMSKKTDHLNVEVQSVNKKVKAAIKEMEKDKICIYLICCILLLGLAGTIYYLYSTGSFSSSTPAPTPAAS